MSDVMSQIGDFLSSGAGKATLGAGVAGTGLLQNLLANNEAQKKQKFVEQLISNPAKFASYVQGFEQPLQAGLTADVNRNASAFGAEHGLGSSPGVMQDIETQALAPYLQQQQSQGENAALQALGIYSGAPTTKPIDVSSILKLLMMSNPSQNPTAGIDPNSVPNPGANLGVLGQAAAQQAGQLPPSLVSGGFNPVTDENN